MSGDQRIDFATLKARWPKLFLDYVAGRDDARAFFEKPLSAEGLLAAAQARKDPPRARAAITAVLERQQRERGLSSEPRRLRALQDPHAVAVVTGQQAGLCGGPLLVLYKALATLVLAEQLEARLDAPVAPIFWIAADDSDFEEIRSLTLLDAASDLRELRYSPLHEPVGQPAARILLDDTAPMLIETLASALTGLRYRDEIAQAVEAAYRPGRSLVAAFAELIATWLPDLIVLDASDPDLKQLMRPVLQREIEEDSPLTRLAIETAAAMGARGYEEQVPVRQGFLHMFVYLQGARRALRATDDGVEVRGTNLHLRRDEALRLLAEQPELWSPGALLRPLAQDFVMPTAAYVGGPAEVAYHAQIGAAYAHFGIPRPAIMPRPSLTLIEPGYARVLESEAVGWPELEQDPAQLLARLTTAAHPQVEAAFEALRAAMTSGMDAVRRELRNIDPTLTAAAESTLGKALFPIEGLRDKTNKTLRRREDLRTDRLRRARAALYPNGHLQERTLGLVSLFARQGTGVIGRIRERMDPWAAAHTALYL